VIIGSAGEVADELHAWVDETDVDGFNLAYTLTPGTFTDMADLVVPELQTRGLFKRDYAPGTFRDKLFGRGPRLPSSHPAASVRVVR
jgi:long-chain alkane monooxygenase